MLAPRRFVSLHEGAKSNDKTSGVEIAMPKLSQPEFSVKSGKATVEDDRIMADTVKMKMKGRRSKQCFQLVGEKVLATSGTGRIAD